MAKKKNAEQVAAGERIRSRREELREQRAAEERRKVQMIAGGIVGIIALVAVVGLIMEFLIVPNQAVANVRGEEISLSDWRERVQYQRAQLVVAVEEQYDLFRGDEAEDTQEAKNQAMRMVQQFSGQQIGILTQGYQQLGEFVLNQMRDEILIRQEAEKQNIAVTEAEVDERVGVRYNYFGGGLPTPRPTGTATVEPTPSLTPVGFVEEVVETPEGDDSEEVVPEEEVPEEEVLPTNTPQPTATAVSEAAFNEELNADLASLAARGANEALLREEATNALYREKLAEALYLEQELPTAVDHLSAYFILAPSQEDAEAIQALIDESEAENAFLDVWNQIRTNNQNFVPPQAAEGEVPTPPTDPLERAQAREFLWRTQEEYAGIFQAGDVTETLFNLQAGETSPILEDFQQNGAVWVITQVSGAELRELDEAALQQRREEALQMWLEAQRTVDVEIYDNWQTRIPRQPTLDTFFTRPVPTPTTVAPPAAPVPADS